MCSVLKLDCWGKREGERLDGSFFCAFWVRVCYCTVVDNDAFRAPASLRPSRGDRWGCLLVVLIVGVG